MPSTKYETDVQTLANASQKVASVNQQVTGRLDQLRGQIESVRSAWKGGAASSFQTLMQRWDEDAKKLNQALQGISDSLTGNQKQYQALEDTNQQSFTSITNRLG